jgi:N-acetylglutamate synthase-like GNAT family acetyltransferase
VLNPSMNYIEHRRDNFLVTTDPAHLDIELIHSFLSNSYWATGIPREVVERSIANSLCFGVYEADKQVGFARVITDYATFAYLADVLIIESHRGRGMSKFLMECIVKHPELQGLRRWTLATRDAHDLYARFGFRPLSKPDRFMELHYPEVYKG